MSIGICRKTTLIIVLFLSFSLVCLGAGRKFTLVIDAGHGGHDSGCVGSEAQEKDINLRAALMLGKFITDNCSDVDVIYTRTTDVFIPLHKRADIANKAKADLFISLHTNSGSNGTAKGFETWTMGIRRSNEKLSAAKRENAVISLEKDYKQHYEGYDPNSPESNIMFEFMHDMNMEKSVELAQMIQNRVCRTAGRTNRGVRQDVFLVLRETSMPACLLELGFITNSEEQELLASDETLEPTVKAIFNAFVAYKDKYKNQQSAVAASTRTANITDSVKNVPPVKTIPAKPVEPSKPAQPVKTAQPKPEETKPGEVIYKVQILAVNRMLRPGSEQFQGHDDVDYYRESGMVKYTIGSSASYQQMARLRKNLQQDFPNAFVVAFRDGQKLDASEMSAEQKKRK